MEIILQKPLKNMVTTEFSIKYLNNVILNQKTGFKRIIKGYFGIQILL